MQVVLIHDVKKLGYQGDILEVAAGYARNYLLPNNLAKEATASVLHAAKKIQAERVKGKEEMAAKAGEIIKSIQDAVLVFAEKVSAEGHLYGSVAEKDIAAKLKKELKITVDKNQVKMPKGHIKEVGSHVVQLHLGGDKDVDVKIEVKGIKAK